MFAKCEKLEHINLCIFNTQNVTDMSFMFSWCKSLTNLDFSNFNTQNVTNMCCMFDGCKSLISLDLSNFNTQNANMNCMLAGCNSLKRENIITKDDKILKEFDKYFK